MTWSQSREERRQAITPRGEALRDGSPLSDEENDKDSSRREGATWEDLGATWHHSCWGDSDWEDDRSPSSWGCDGGYDEWPSWGEIEGPDISPLNIGDRRRDRRGENNKGKDPETKDQEEHVAACYPICCGIIHDLFDEVGDARRAITSLEARLRILKDTTDLDFKFLNANATKFFGMVWNLRRGLANHAP